jgi:hypothetical protein
MTMFLKDDVLRTDVLAADPLREALCRLDGLDLFGRFGCVARVSGPEVEVRGLPLRVGEHIELAAGLSRRQGEVVGITPLGAVALLFDDADGVGQGAARWAWSVGGRAGPFGRQSFLQWNGAG